MSTPALKAALWARVSTAEQHASNQLTELRDWAAAREFQVTAEYITEDSAWTRSGNRTKGAEFEAARSALLEGARRGSYQVVLTWGIDRLSRRGAEDMLNFVRRLTDTGCRLWSLKDPWAESTSDPMTRELLFSVFATIARFESERRSDQIKAGIERRRRDIAAGRKVRGRQQVGGRIPGRKDKQPRVKVTGEAKGWTPERREALAARNRERAAGRRQQEGQGLR
jgi:DNA invertase Pin-like site-specific DNA recombinase